MKSKYYQLFLICFFLIDQCNGQSENFDYGTIKDNKYSNAFFKFTMDVPAGWEVQSEQKIKEFRDKGIELISGDDEKLKKAIDASTIVNATMLVVIKMDSIPGYKSNLNIGAVNIKQYPEIKTGYDYLQITKKFLSQGSLVYKDFKNSTVKKSYAGADFYTMECTYIWKSYEVHQTSYSTTKNGFALLFTISYVKDNQKDELEKALQSINFGKSTK